MVFVLFFRCLYGIEYNMTNSNMDTIFDQGSSVFVRFYSPKCRISRISATEFSKAAHHFQNIIFLNVDCTKFSSFCKKHLVVSFPSFYLFKDGKLPYFTFTKERTAEDMIELIELKTQNYNTSTLKALHEVDFLTYTNVIESNECVVFYFHLSFLRPSRVYRSIITENLHVFNADEEIRFAEMNCNNYNKFCQDTSFPSTKIYVNRTIKFNGLLKSPQEFVNTVNRVCQANRMMNGHLMPHIGVDKMTEAAISKFNKMYRQNTTEAKEWVDNILSKYLEKDNDIFLTKYISLCQLKRFISELMKKVLINGPQFLLFYLNTTQKLANDIKTSMKNRNNLDVRANVINVFIKYFYP